MKRRDIIALVIILGVFLWLVYPVLGLPSMYPGTVEEGDVLKSFQTTVDVIPTCYGVGVLYCGVTGININTHEWTVLSIIPKRSLSWWCTFGAGTDITVELKILDSGTVVYDFKKSLSICDRTVSNTWSYTLKKKEGTVKCYDYVARVFQGGELQLEKKEEFCW